MTYLKMGLRMIAQRAQPGQAGHNELARAWHRAEQAKLDKLASIDWLGNGIENMIINISFEMKCDNPGNDSPLTSLQHIRAEGELKGHLVRVT